MEQSLYSSMDILQRMVEAVELVRQRLLRTVSALSAAGVPHAVSGGNAVAAWVATVNRAAVRNTRDVDILVRRSDLPVVQAALEKAGFVYRHAAGLDMFLDGPGGDPREGVHLIFAGEKVRPSDMAASPTVEESTDLGTFRTLNLESLIRVKLMVFRDKDRMHLRDMIDVGLIDASWIAKLPPALGTRLQTLLDTPDG